MIQDILTVMWKERKAVLRPRGSDGPFPASAIDTRLTGRWPGFAAFMRLYPDEDLGIVILANGTNLEYHDIADAIADIEW